MADQRSSRKGEGLGGEPPRAHKTDSHLRLVTADGKDLFTEAGEPNDDSPTIISKTPVRATEATMSADGNSLRGRKLAHFELLEPIGVGGMAAVLRARDSQLDRFVALKILPPEMARDQENVRRFHQEARAAAKLDHENIARVFFCGEDQGLHFIAFEYVEGDNLRVILERRGRLPVGEAIRYILQVAAGLEHANSRGVVHRDVKPSNIIISPNGRAKIVDMGLARNLEPHADNGLTQSGVTLGTFDYISPEQALEPREADGRSDIYSLGCTLYHMLTGQPPVPEGTAAKKLHHHQHIAPIDPRQLNPEIPDEVAQVLGKMMAKNPRERFQRSVHLVQHLMRIAQKSGIGDDNPEALFVDVQMPVETQRRPLMLASFAVLALAALLFILSLVPQGQQKANDPVKVGPKAGPETAFVKKTPEVLSKTNIPPTPQGNTAIVRSEDDLRKLLEQAQDNQKIFVTLEGDLLLSGNLKIGGSPKSRPVVEIVGSDRVPARLWLNLAQTPTGPVAGLRVEGANVAFKNLRFEVVGAETLKRLDVAVASVAVAGGSVVDFEQCSFSQSGLPLDIPFIARRQQGLIPAASILVESALRVEAESPKVTVRDCVFAAGQTGIAVVGPTSAKLALRDCAFHTLGALVHLRGGGDPTITFEHCSAYLRNGPAFRIDDETLARLKIEYSLFSVPENAARTGDEPDLIRQTDSKDPAKVIYQGLQNGYHNLNALWVSRSLIVPVDDLKKFRQEIAGTLGFDKDSQVLPKEPSPFLNEAARADDPFQAFQLNPSVRELQTPREKHPEHAMLGIRRVLEKPMPRLGPLSVESPQIVANYKPAANEKVVDPDHRGGTPGYYDSLAEALAVARPGDIVTLKPSATNPEFALKPTDLEFDLTIRGYPGTQPTLTLADTRISDASLFRLLEGKLHLESLNLLLEPTRDGHAAQCLVAMVGNGSVSIKGCVITLKPRDRNNLKATPLSVVTMVAAEDAKMMMSDARPIQAAPSLSLQDCFVRGEGDLVTLRGSRPLQIVVNQSLLYLGGSLLHQQQGTSKEIANPDAIQSLKLTRSVVLFAEPMIWLQIGKTLPRFQHPVKVEQAEHCLFATMNDHPLIALEQPEMTEKMLPTIFDWKGKDNVYVHFEKAYLLEHSPPDDGLRNFHLDEAGWKESMPRDTEAEFFPQAFSRVPARPLSQAMPDDLKPRQESQTDVQPYFDQLPRFHLPKRDPAN